MKLTKKLEAEIRKLYEAYWNSYINGDLETYTSLLDEEFKFIGSTEAEALLSKKASIKMLDAVKEQMAGKAAFRNRNIKVELIDELIQVSELCDGYILIGTEWNFYSRFRLSSLLKKKRNKWKFIHQHVSMPDSKAQEGEAYGLEQIRTENIQLRDAVKRRTIELEHKNQELEIEAALERVRSRTNSMHLSESLHDVINEVNDQLRLLGFRFDGTDFLTDHSDKGYNIWLANFPTPIYVPAIDHKLVRLLKEVIKRGDDFLAFMLTTDEKNIYFKNIFENTVAKNLPEELKQYVYNAKGMATSCVVLENIILSVTNFASIPYSDTENEILKRFAKVFEQSYTRFLDLQKAEAQAREAQIELGLERVRARAMAMQKSGELSELVDTVFKELTKLDFALTWCIINIIDESSMSNTVWAANPDITKAPESYHMLFEDYPFHHAMMKGWKERNTKSVYTIEGDEKRIYDDYLFSETEFKRTPEAAQAASRAMEKYVVSFSFSNFGGLQTVGDVPLSDANLDILSRFGKVFDLTYTRFNDLKQAEAQARESQIQLALERVRARTMAMQHSDELKDAAALLFQQVKSLGVPAYSCGYNIWEKNEKTFTSWMSTQDGSDFNAVQNIPLTEDANFIRFADSREKSEQFFVLELRNERMQEHYEYLKTIPAFKAYFDYALSVGFELPETQIHHLANFSQGNLLFITLEPCPEFHDVFKRFAAVFEQTYTRFLDLQKAEAQAKESQIQLALERVRARTMAMQRSDELPGAATILFQQVQSLGMSAFAAGYCIWDEDKQAITLWMSSEGILQPPFKAPTTEDELFIEMRKGHEEGKSFHVVEMGGEKLVAHYQYMRTLPVVGEIFDSIIEAGHPLPTFQIMHHAYFSKGFLLFITYEPVPDAHDIFMRFGKVFDQTYTRFIDLQKAEAQAKEAQIEAALEKVRSRSLAMHNANELGEVVTVIVEKLKDLGVVLDVNGVILCTYFQHSKNVMHWIVSPDYSMAGSYLLPYFDHPIFNVTWQSKQNGDEYFSKAFSVLEKNSFFEYAFEHSDYKYFPEDFKQWIFQNDKHVLSFAWQKNSAILIPSHTGVLPTESDKAILIRFAKVFEQSYVRFLDLQKSEEQARESQIQLALERVRARTMAMQKSDELPETSYLFFQQVKELGLTAAQNSIAIINEETGFVELSTTVHGHHLPHTLNVPMNDPYVMAKAVAAWKAKRKSLTVEIEGQELKNYNEHRNSFFETKVNFPEDQWIVNLVFFSKGWLSFSSDKKISGETFELLKRFAAVFEQTYIRFNDLKQAEEQARESRIQLALERVRARTMAMQRSDELMETAVVLFDQLKQLGENIERTIIGVMNEEERVVEIWGTRPDGSQMEKRQKFPVDEPILMEKIYAAWREQKKSIVIDLQGEELESYFQFLKSRGPKLKRENFGERRVENFAFFSKGMLGVISADPNTPANVGLYERFAAVFDQTYTRFLDLQKAEAQAKEAQIETALERVRSRTMGMQKSEELKEVIQVLYDQFVHLNIHVEHTGFVMDYKTRDDYNIWIADHHGAPSRVTIPYFDSLYYNRFNEAKKNGEDFFATKLSFEEKNKFYQKLFEYVPGLPEDAKKFYFSCPGLAASTVLLDNVGLYIENFSGIPFTDEDNNILMRFGKVFQQTYTRFLDLQKAEAQAREAKIETALEKVRASTMAMQHSDHLSETAFVLFKQFKELGEAPERIFIATFDEEQQGIIDIWGTNQGGNQLNKLFKVSAEEPTLISKIITAWKEKKRSVVIDLKGEELKQYISFLRSTGIPVVEGIMEERRVQTIGCFSKGVIGVTTPELQSAESVQLLERFAGVFDLTYTRFLDLQQAEAQAREAKIEAALERVRSRTMAMQHSDELKDAALLLFQQVQSFGVDQWACGYNIWEADGKTCTAWMARQGALQPPFKTHPAVDHCFQRFYDAKQRGESFYVDEIGGDEIKTHYKRLISLPEFKSAPKEFFDEFIAPEFQIFHIAYFDQGYLMFITYKQVPETWDIFKRFAKVFEQTYTRFLDLQKAEAQAREAKIEAALEKVRSRTMAMQTSTELTDVAGLLFEQVSALGIKTWTAGFNVWSEDNNSYVDYITSPQGGFIEPYTVYTETAEALTDISNARKSGVEFDVQYVEGEKIKQLYLALTRLDEKQYEIMLQDGVRFPSHQYEHFVFGSKVSLMFITYEPVPEAHDIFKRLGKVFEQTYTRFLDLQKAEAQAREAIKQASVDRIRAEIASMRTTNDLERIQPLVWNELTTLGVPFTRCGVFIMDEEHEKVDTFLSTPDGKSIASFTSNYSDVAVISEALPYWRKKEIYKAHWDEATFLAQAQTLLSQGNITSTETYFTEHRPKDLYLHFLPFLQGILYVGNETPLKDDELQLVQNLADAFSIAYARYEDFNKLELAKEQIENTLTNLKQAQAQLVQSEKMASLGELTAGIAHEIQNPLNFVNNFSEVNTELIAEMKDEIEKGNIEEVKAIANDIADNEQKINHHGKRADAIVKGMLQHSRSSSGVKEPFDINVLADEYLRLAYHGLRAKDKSFNATMKTDYDETIGKINIVPQEVGRSVLNLITNAFYAVSERKKQKAEGYEPTVTVTTKRINGKVEIRVADNGNGIPQKVLDKIFQPFFTTKPTGQGTGLGLSLSYDIVKAHNGELKVETNEGEGSEFIIFLPANN